MSELDALKAELERLKAEKAGTCPNCGYCPHCGRSATPIYFWPYYVPYGWTPSPPTWITAPGISWGRTTLVDGEQRTYTNALGSLNG